jgi:uncharacterized protein
MVYRRSITAPKESFFLFGPRGTGKSSWLAQQFPKAFHVDLLDEDLFATLLARPGQLADLIRSVDKKAWIIIDEVQRVPSVLNEVHRSIENEKRKFVLCGSSARKLRREGVNLLAGRALERRMHPFLSLELGANFKLNEVLRFGAIPIVWSSTTKKEKLKAYVQTYLKQEIQAEALVRNLAGFVRFLPVAALFHGQVVNVSNIARECGVARTTVEGYLEILVDTLVAFKLEPFSPKLKVKELKHPKLYFCDPGLTRGIKGLYGEVAPEEIGALFEGWLIQEVRALNDYFDLFDDMKYWSSHDTSGEVDLILRQGKRLFAIEIKASEKYHSSDGAGLRAIAGLSGLKRKILVYRGKNRLKTDEGIEVLPYLEFLKELQQGL